MLKWRNSAWEEMSIYVLDYEGVNQIEFNLLGVEFVFDQNKVPVREIKVKRDRHLTPFEQYQKFTSSRNIV